MDLICHQDEDIRQDSSKNEERKQRHILHKAGTGGKTSKENQLRKFAKQIFNRHLIQAQESTTV